MSFLRRTGLFVMLCFLCAFSYAQDIAFTKGMGILRKAYPDVEFSFEYEEAKNDWRIELLIPKNVEDSSCDFREATLYWCGGRMLPEDELINKDKYWPILYHYPKELADPANFTQEQIEAAKDFGSSDNRQNGAGTPMFFFDALYDSSSRARIESRIKKVTFLGFRTNIHERIADPLQRVESKLRFVAERDDEVKNWINSLKSTDAYYWRIISGTNRKSFHSLGIALDVLPKRLGGKQIFWSWTKDINPDGWMLTPLKDRWIPPQRVIAIFEGEGFIWGGKWGVWDNMHFEYHPELIIYNYFTTQND